MTKKTLIGVIFGWILLAIFNHYYMPWFLLALEFAVLFLIIFIVSIVQIVRATRERKHLTKSRIQKIMVSICLLFLTFNSLPPIELIEKIDWLLLENRRNVIVAQAKNGKLNPNVSWNGWVYELPYEFPIVSHGGNDIGIFRNKESGTLTVSFWVFRNFFNNPSTKIIYSNNPNTIKRLESYVANRPNDNWKIKDNWYRIYNW